MSEEASEHVGYPDCQFCRGAGFWRVIASGTYQPGDQIACGNCRERAEIDVIVGRVTKAFADDVKRIMNVSPAVERALHPSDREAIALALVNEARRFSGFSLYDSLSQLEPHQYRDQLRYADAILALSGSLAPANPTEKGETK